MANADSTITDHSDPFNREPAFDKDARATVESAVHALYIIRRLATRALAEPAADGCGDAATFCCAIKQLALLHGKDLDACVGRVTGSSGGYFDEHHQEVRHD